MRHVSVDVTEGSFATAKAAALRAWAFCEEEGHKMPSMDWTVVQGKFGEEGCYSAMTRTEDSDLDKGFVAYMSRRAPVTLTGPTDGATIKISRS